MKLFTSILILIYLLVAPGDICAQNTDSVKINDLFIQYIGQELDLKKPELSKLRPLAKKYLTERKNVIKAYKDPLERERQTIMLKIKYRRQFTPILGEEKANAFFIQEQNFRRKVKEELRKRKNKSLNIN